MASVAEGDLDAFEQIVLRHQRSAWQTAFHFTGDATEAEDLAQEAFLRILEAAGRYRPSAKFATFLHRVVGRLCLDYAKKKRPRYTGSLPDTPNGSSSPADALADQERERMVRKALDSLAPRQRLAVILRHYEDFSTADIAEAMGTSSKAVERLLARGRADLKRHLGEFLEE